VLTAVALAAAAVSAAGPIEFVAFVVPQIALRLCGGARPPLIVSAVLGALLVAGADLLARVALPGRELPVGLITAVVGAPSLQWSPADQEVVTEALEWTDMRDLADRPVEALSGGQRQRAWISMALAQGTEVLLLDEPTTFLDLAHQIDVLDLVKRLHRERRRT